MKFKQTNLLAFSVLFLTACAANPNQVTKSSSPKTVIETTQLKQQTNPYQINYDDIDYQDLNLNIGICLNLLDLHRNCICFSNKLRLRSNDHHSYGTTYYSLSNKYFRF